MPPTPATSADRAKLEKKRAERRKSIEDSEVDPAIKLLVLVQSDHADEEVDTWREGLSELKAEVAAGNATRDKAHRQLVMGAGAGAFALIVFLVSGLMLARGLDPEQAARATREVVHAIAPSTEPTGAAHAASPQDAPGRVAE